MPLAAGVLLPYLVWRVGRRVSADGTALLAAAVSALAPTLVQYSVVLKPYITDAAIALVLFDAALTVLERPSERGPWVWLAAVGLIAVGGSLPAPLLLSGVAAALFLGAPAARWRLAGCLALGRRLRAALPGAVPAGRRERVHAAVLGSELLHADALERLAAPRPERRPVARRPAGAAGPRPSRRDTRGRRVLGVGARARPSGRSATRSPNPRRARRVGVAALPLSARLLLGIVPTLVLCCAAGIAAVTQWHAAVGRGIGAVTLLALAAVNVTHPYRTPALRPAVLEVAPRRPASRSTSRAGRCRRGRFTRPTGRRQTQPIWNRSVTGRGGRTPSHFPNAAPRGRASRTDRGRSARGASPRAHRDPRARPWNPVARGDGLSGHVPDSGWANREAARIQRGRGTRGVADRRQRLRHERREVSRGARGAPAGESRWIPSRAACGVAASAFLPCYVAPAAPGGAGAAELKMSRAICHDPSACLRSICRNLPWSSTAAGAGGRESHGVGPAHVGEIPRAADVVDLDRERRHGREPAAPGFECLAPVHGRLVGRHERRVGRVEPRPRPRSSWRRRIDRTWSRSACATPHGRPRSTAGPLWRRRR